MTTPIELHLRLRAARKAAGYKTAKAFIDKHAIPASTYSQYENGMRSMDEENLKRFSKLFKVDYDWLATGEGLPFKNKGDEARAKIFQAETLDLHHVVKTAPLISEILLAAILEALMKANKKMTAPALAHAATVIYSEVVRTKGTLEDQLKAVELAVNTFLRLGK